MLIVVLFRSFSRVEIDTKASDTIDDVKAKIHDKKRIPPYMQRLIFADKPLGWGGSFIAFKYKNDFGRTHSALVQRKKRIWSEQERKNVYLVGRSRLLGCSRSAPVH